MENTNIINTYEKYFDTSSIDIDMVTEELSSHMRNKLYYNPNPFRTYKETKISEDYSTKNLRETIFISNIFKNANLDRTGLAGSIFDNVTFLPSNYKNTNFHSSDFRYSRFMDCYFLNSTFDKSIFWNTEFDNCELDNVSMCDCKFINCSFNNCKWTIRIENTIFKDTTIKNTIFKDMNFEFSEFDNIHLSNLKLPFPTIPFIYGGLNYLYSTKDEIRITSQTDKLGIDKKEYLNCLPQLESYYIFTQNYFPLSNILISQKKYQKALACIFKGMEISVMIRRFRMLPNYCKLLSYIPDADVHIKQYLFMKLLLSINDANLKEFEKDNLSLYLPQVSSMLIGDSMQDSITVFFDTNINGNDSKKISILYKIIDNLFDGICTYSIKLKHNSPLTVLLQFFSDQENVSIIISIIETVFLAIQTATSVYGIKKKKQYEIHNIDEKIIGSQEIENREENAKTIIHDNNIIINNISITNYGDVRFYKNS